MHSQVHFALPHRLPCLFLAVDRDLFTRIASVSLHKLRAFHKHTTGATGWIEDQTMIGLENFDDQLNNGSRCEELTAALSFLQGDFVQEIFVDFAEEITLDVYGIAVERCYQGPESVIIDRGVVIGWKYTC